MTRDEVLAMKPGRELDALVMRTVFKAEKKDIGDECYWVSEVNGEEVCWPRWFSPSTDIAAAFEVLEEIKGRRICIEKTLSGSFYCVIGHSDDGHKPADYQAQTAPEAICKAALLAVMGE